MFVVHDTNKELFIATFRHCIAMVAFLSDNARCTINLGWHCCFIIYEVNGTWFLYFLICCIMKLH